MKNLKLKLFLENTVLPTISKFNARKKHDQHKVLFYINSDLRESNKVLFDYMLEHGYNKKYEIVVACRDYAKYVEQKIANVRFISCNKATFEFFSSGKVFYSVGRIPFFPAKDQVVMQMWHGVPLKNADEGLKKTHTLQHQYYTWLLSPSEHLKPVFSKWLSVPEERIYVGGYPRCDYLFCKEKKYDFGEYNKLILWTPTFRKSATRGYSDVDMKDRIIPILSADKFKDVNEYLRKLGVKVIVKLHPAQDLSNYNLVELDHFILLSHSEFMAKKMDLYYLASQTDALITDYSSIYFDYMLIDKPIGFTIDDMEEYKANRGFSLDPEVYMPGTKMASYDELLDFFKEVSEGADSYAEERRAVNELVNQYREGGYCKRILEFCGVTL